MARKAFVLVVLLVVLFGSWILTEVLPVARATWPTLAQYISGLGLAFLTAHTVSDVKSMSKQVPK